MTTSADNLGRDANSPHERLSQLPAVTLLDRIPVPVLAIADSGSILFANNAFAEMLGYSVDALLSLRAEDIFGDHVHDGRPSQHRSTFPHSEVLLKHAEGYYARTLMSGSALKRHDDAVTLVTFQDLTASLWSNG